MICVGVRMTGRSLLRTAVAISLMGSLAACAGFKGPSNPFHFGGDRSKKASARVAPGQRIPVLETGQTLKPSSALAGVDFAIPEPQAQAEWPQPGGDVEHNVDHVAAGANLEIAWRRHIGAGLSRFTHIIAPPVVADGVIFAMDGKAGISALEAASGREVWHADLADKRGADREALGGGLAYADGVLYVTSGYRFVAALEAKTGHLIWKVLTTSPIHSAPTVSGGKVYAIDVVDQLTAFDAKTGSSTWTYQALEEPARMLIASSPAVSGDEVIAPFASGELVALSAPNGTDLWVDTLTFTNRNNALSEIRDISGRPIIYRGTVYAGSHSGVLGAVDLHTGQRTWSLPVSMISAPWPAGDVIYIMSQEGNLICAARDSGQVYWIKRLNEPLRKKFRANWSGPMLASNHLVMVSDKGEFLALNPKNGSFVKSIRLGLKSGSFQAPIASGGLLYVLADDGELIAIR